MLQARSTDPLTSKLSALKTRSGLTRALILDYLKTNGASNVYEIAVGLNKKETTISSQMRPLARLGLIHEVGTLRSEETGHERITWDIGGTPGGMPAKKTGPLDKLKFRLFEKEEVIRLLQTVHEDGDVFQNLTDVLNAEMPRRVY